VKTGLFFVRQMLRLGDAGIRVLTVRGNHDAASRVIRHLLLPAHVTELGLAGPQTVVLDDLGIAVHGQSYTERATYENLASQYPPPMPGMLNIGVLHTSAEGRCGHDPYAPCRRRQLAHHGYDYWALGHVHAREVLADAPWVVFRGNLQGRSLRESGAKGATVVTERGGEIVQVRHRPVDVVRFILCRIDVADAASLDEVLERTHARLMAEGRRGAGRALAVRVVLSGADGVAALLSQPLEVRRQALQSATTEVTNSAVWLEGVWGEVAGDVGGRWKLDGERAPREVW
jgi:DNA repair exonuclease SbcCD nuclease subunit